MDLEQIENDRPLSLEKLVFCALFYNKIYYCESDKSVQKLKSLIDSAENQSIRSIQEIEKRYINWYLENRLINLVNLEYTAIDIYYICLVLRYCLDQNIIYENLYTPNQLGSNDQMQEFLNLFKKKAVYDELRIFNFLKKNNLANLVFDKGKIIDIKILQNIKYLNITSITSIYAQLRLGLNLKPQDWEWIQLYYERTFFETKLEFLQLRNLALGIFNEGAVLTQKDLGKYNQLQKPKIVVYIVALYANSRDGGGPGGPGEPKIKEQENLVSINQAKKAA